MYETKPWLQHYSKGVPANIDTEAYGSIQELLDESFKKYANLVMYSNMGKKFTFAEVDKLSYQMGAYLQSRGLEPGDRIAIMMPNLLQYPIAVYGAIRAGLILVNTNPLYTPREMRHQLSDSGCKGIIICENFAANLEEVMPDTPIKVIVTTSIGEMLPVLKRTVVNFMVRTVKRMVPKYNLLNPIPFTTALDQGKTYKIKPFTSTLDDVLLHQYTGGTTGVAKGAMLTHRNVLSNMLQIRAIMMPRMNQQDEIALCALPLYHVYAFTLNLMALPTYGVQSVLVTNARDIKSVLKEFGTHKVSVFSGVNTLFNAMINHPNAGTTDFTNLKICVAGAMAVQKAVSDKWKKLTGCPIAEGFGMTECSPVACINPIDGTGQDGTVGLPIPNTLMRCVDDNGVPVPVGESGEIQVKGPQVMKGYYNRPEETANTLRDGWLCTGDIGLMQPDGFFKIVDRKKDMILVSGFNVYPNEIEDVVGSHPKVLECAVIGLPDDKTGEAVKLFIVKKDSSLDKAEIIAFCRENLTNYKIPKAVEFRTELPKTNVGKILRRALRDEATAK